MEPASIFLIVIVFGIIIAVIMAVSQTSNENTATEFAKTKIEERGIQQSIIKECKTKCSSLEPPHGRLMLTWDELLFFGVNTEILIPIKSIRSTACENSDLIVTNIDGDERRFRWDEVVNSTRGMGATFEGNVGMGYGLTRSNNPIPREWQQIIDDVRFGRIHKQF